MCILRSSDSLWGEPVHQVLSEGSGRDRKAHGAWTDGTGTHIVRLVYGHGMALLCLGGSNRPSPTGGGQVGTSEPVWRFCGTHIEVLTCSSPCLNFKELFVAKCGCHGFGVGRDNFCEHFHLFHTYRVFIKMKALFSVTSHDRYLLIWESNLEHTVNARFIFWLTGNAPDQR